MEHNDAATTLQNISKILDGRQGPKSVFILSIAPGFPREAVIAVRSHCESMIGVQCCFVKAVELEKRYHGAGSREMVMYTGQIARKIFGRASIAELPSHSSIRQSLRPTGQTAVGRLFGIHVSSVRNIRPMDAVNTQHLYLVTVVSVSSGQNVDLCTSYHFASLNQDLMTPQYMASQLSACSGEHTAQVSYPEMRCSAVYVTGLANANANRLGIKTLKIAITNELATKLGNKAKFNRQQCTMIVIEPQFKMTVRSGSGELVLPLESPLRNEDVPEIQHDYQLHDRALRRIYRRPDGFRKADGGLREPTETYHVIYQRADSEVSYSIRLEKRHLPDILHLAKAASKRGQSHIVLDQSVGRTPNCRYKMEEVHDKLEGSLYYT